MPSPHESHTDGSGTRRWVLLGFLAIAGFYLITEHRAHLVASLSWLPVAFLLLCPLLHMGMHGGHGHAGHGGRSERARGTRSPLPADRPGAPDAPVIPAAHRHAKPEEP